ncbi:hypothetical protein BGX34_002185 [Mortierella sp. NVP85]|nr:hypothetical protein BGX34_002185 [Mortierella sp. NVP85]
MNPSQPVKTSDKENDLLPEAATRSVPTLIKQASLVGSRASTVQGLKMGLTRTTSQQGKITPQTQTVNSPAILRTKTNYQQTPDAPPKKSTLTRTFSATFESNTGINTAPESPVHSESRRRSLTRRGSTTARLIVHKDEELSKQPLENDGNRVKEKNNTPSRNTKPNENLVKNTPIESATTLLSIERAVESEEKVVVGAAETKTKRRALTNDEELWDIEYCPPPVEEQPYDPGFELDAFALSIPPPVNAFHLRRIETFEIGLPTIELAPITRPTPLTELEKEKAKGPMPKSMLSTEGHLEFTWSDDEDEGGLFPKGDRCSGVKDLYDDSKTLPPFEGFIFDLEGSEDSLSEDEDDILGAIQSAKQKADKPANEFNETFGLEDLEDEGKVTPAFTDFQFKV